MKTFLEKFGKLIALHPTAPNCLPVGMTADDITAAGTLDREGNPLAIAAPQFVTDTDTLNLRMTDALNDCAADSIWTLLNAARRNAVTEFETALLAGISTLNRAVLQPFSGTIGQTDSRGVLSFANGTRVITTLPTKDLPGAFIKVTGIGLLLAQDADVLVTLPGEGGSVLVVCSANTPSFATLATPVLIPFDGSGLSFSYVVNNFTPRNNKLNCDCSGMNARLQQYFTGLVDTPANGLLIKAEIECNPLALIANNYDDTPAIRNVMATTLLFKTLEKAIERIQNSGIVSRYTMMESEYLWGKRNHYRKEYQERINWLTSPEGLNIGLSACYACKVGGQSGIRKGAILA